MNEPQPETEEVGYLSIGELQERFKSGGLTSRTLVETLLRRIDYLNKNGQYGLNAIMAIAPDALDQADKRDAERAAGTITGPLHGIPVLIKDNIEVVGLPSSAGSYVFSGVARKDGEVVRRLRASGAIILGSTNMSEWASFGSGNMPEGWSSRGGLTGNPWWLDRGAGGSSSGSAAAVCAGFAPVALGTETVGSITYPASATGVVGYKPSVGSVPSAGVIPVSRRQDGVGVLARTFNDAKLVADVLVDEVLTEPPDVPSFALVRDKDLTDSEILRVLELISDLISFDYPLTECKLPNLKTAQWDAWSWVLAADMQNDLPGYLQSRDDAQFLSLDGILGDAESGVSLHGCQPDLALIENAAHVNTEVALSVRDEIRNQASVLLLKSLGAAHALIGVAYGPVPKPDVTQSSDGGNIARAYTSGLDQMASVVGWPVITIPIGVVRNLPIGLAMTAPSEREPALCAAARLVESLMTTYGPLIRPTWLPPGRG